MRRVRAADGQVYQVRPSFMMPYQIGYTHEVAKGLYMYFTGASFDQITHEHGHSDMYWYRAFTSLGRNSLVGTTVKSPDKLPQNLLADEKHTWWHKERVYLATTVAKGCFLGAALAESPSTESLSKAYAEFEQEAKALDSDYLPKTVNLDGWNGTQGAWKTLFGGHVVFIFCLLHVALKIRDRCRRWEKKQELMKRVWKCVKAESLFSYGQQIRRLKEWTLCQEMPSGAKEKVLELCARAGQYKRSHHFRDSHKTSNALDRLMDYQDRMLYGMKYLHSYSLAGSGRLLVRAMALLWNFHPYNKKVKRHSPFADLNGFVYHQHWLENMMIAASLGGRYLDQHKTVE